MSYTIDIFDKKTNQLIHSITGCRTHSEAIQIAASFRDDTQKMVIRKCVDDGEKPIMYITEAQSEYVLAKTKALLGRIEKSKNSSKELQEAIDCIKWLRRWFTPIVDPDNN